MSGTPLIDVIRYSILEVGDPPVYTWLRGRYSPFQRLTSLEARAASRSASLAMITLRLS